MNGMNQAHAHSDQPHDLSPQRLGYVSLILLLGALVPPIVLYNIGGSRLILPYLAVGVSLVLLFYPRTLFILFVLSTSLYLRAAAGPFMILPSDALGVLLLAAVMVEFLARGEVSISRTGLDWPFLALISATLVSIPFAHNVSMTFTPAVRIVFIYLMFRVSFRLARQFGIHRVLRVYIGLVTVLSAINAVRFLIGGGEERIFGPAWLTIETYTMTALPMAMAFIIWSKSRGERLAYGAAVIIIALALLATQSRAPQLAVFITLPVLAIMAVRKLQRSGVTVRWGRIGLIVVIPVALIAGLTLFAPTLLEGVFGRIEEFLVSLSNPQGTVALRVVLWTGAIKGFLTSPFTGIGIGNFRIIDQIVPEMKLEPVWYYIGGLSTHNVILQYLCETGIVGAAALLALTLKGLQMGYRCLTIPGDARSNQTSAAIFIGMFVFALTILYMRAWTWGQDGHVMAILFGLTAAWYAQSRESDGKRSDAAHSG